MKGIISVFLILAIIHTHGAPMDKSEWVAAIQKLQKERDPAIQKPLRIGQNLNDVRISPYSDYLQWFLRHAKYRNVQTNNGNHQGKRPLNLLCSQSNQSDLSDNDCDNDESTWISARRKTHRRKITTEKTSTEEDSGEKKSDESIIRKRSSYEKDSSDRSSYEKGHRRGENDHGSDTSESLDSTDDSNSSDHSSSSKSRNRGSRRHEHVSRDKKRRRESREEENRKRSSLSSESSDESESDEEEFKQYLRNVLQKRHQKEIVQMLRNQKIGGRDNPSRTEAYYNRLYKWNRDKFVEWKKRIELKKKLLSEKQNLNKEKLKRLCKISEETEEDLEEDRIKECVKNHLSTNDRFDIITRLSGNHPPRSDGRQVKKTVRVEEENGKKVVKVSVLVNKTLDNGESAWVEINKEREEGSPSLKRKVVNKVIDKGDRTVIISTDSDRGALIKTINKVAADTGSDQETNLTGLEVEAGGRLPSSNPSNVQNPAKEEDSNVANDKKPGNEKGEEAGPGTKASSQDNVILINEQEVQQDTISKSGTVVAVGEVDISGNKETADQGSSTLNNAEHSSKDNKKEPDSSIGASQDGGLLIAHEEQETKVIKDSSADVVTVLEPTNVKDNGEKSDNNADGSTPLADNGTEPAGESEKQNQPEVAILAPDAAAVNVVIVESETVGSSDKTSGDGDSNVNVNGDESQGNDQNVTSNAEDNGTVTEASKSPSNTVSDNNEIPTSNPNVTKDENSKVEQTESSRTTKEQSPEVSKTENNIVEIPATESGVNVDNNVNVATEPNHVSDDKTDSTSKESVLVSETESTTTPESDSISVVKELNVEPILIDVNVWGNAIIVEEHDAVNSGKEPTNSSISESQTLNHEGATQRKDSNTQNIIKELILLPALANSANESSNTNAIVNPSNIQVSSVSEQGKNIAPEEKEPEVLLVQIDDAGATESQKEAESSSFTSKATNDGNIITLDNVVGAVEPSNLLDINQQSGDTVEKQTESSAAEPTKRVEETVTGSENQDSKVTEAVPENEEATSKPESAVAPDNVDVSNNENAAASENNVVESNDETNNGVSQQTDSAVDEYSTSAGTPATSEVENGDVTLSESPDELSNSSSKSETPLPASNVDAPNTAIVNEENNNNDLSESNAGLTDTNPDENTSLKNPEESATLPSEETESTTQTKGARTTDVELNSEPETTVLDNNVDASNNPADVARTSSSLDESPAISTDSVTERAESNNDNNGNEQTATAAAKAEDSFVTEEEAAIENSTSQPELNSLGSNNIQANDIVTNNIIANNIVANDTVNNDDQANSATEQTDLGVSESATLTDDDATLLETQTENSNAEETEQEAKSPSVELGSVVNGENVNALNDVTNASDVNNNLFLVLNGSEKLSDSVDEPVDLNIDQSTVVDGVQAEGSTSLWAKIGFSLSPASITSDSTSTNDVELNLTDQAENLATIVNEDTKTSEPTYNTVVSEAASWDETIESSTLDLSQN